MVFASSSNLYDVASHWVCILLRIMIHFFLDLIESNQSDVWIVTLGLNHGQTRFLYESRYLIKDIPVVLKMVRYRYLGFL